MGLNKNGVVNQQLERQLENYKNALSKAEGHEKKLRGCLDAIAEKICDEQYALNQLGGKNEVLGLSDYELRDFIVSNYYKQRVNFTNTIGSLQKLYLQEKADKDMISHKMLDIQTENSTLQSQINNLEYKIRQLESQTVQIPGENTGQNKKTANKRNINEENNRDTKEGKIVDEIVGETNNNRLFYTEEGNPCDINELYNRVDVLQKAILKIMGEQGVNETVEIENASLELDEFNNTTKIRKTMELMVTNNLIQCSKNPIASRPKLTLYYLTDIGIAMYKKIFHQSPVKNEMTKICEMHDNLTHGYCIKDVSVILANDYGYTDVCMDSSRNTFAVPGNNKYIPDITASFNGKKTFWEIELGNHHNNDFFIKMEKAAQVTNDVYIVVDKISTKDHLTSQINKFIGNLKREKKNINMTITLGTMKELKDKSFFNSEENILQIGKK